MSPSMTIGMATHQDFHGVYFTLQALKLYHRDELQNCEIIVVDQSPNSPQGKEVNKLISSFGHAGCHSAKYIPYTEHIGTSASRQKIMDEASGPVVVVMDCHILLLGSALFRIEEYFNNPDNSLNILSGPLLTDAIFLPKERPVAGPFTPSYSVLATHYADHWRSAMWGTWANTYQCSCVSPEFNLSSDGKPPFMFSVWNQGGLCRYETVTMNPKEVERCPVCHKSLPLLAYYGHESSLEKSGYLRIGDVGVHPFEIPGQGLGLYACRKDAWPGFNPDTWGFGGEELYIHEKFRRAGGKAVCHPDVKWVHRFPRPETPTYPNTHWYKTRNYLLEYLELGLDTEIVRKHFVDDEKIMSASEWNALANNPIDRVHGPTEQFVQPVMIGGTPKMNYIPSLVEIFNKHQSIKRDLNEHMEVIRKVASQCSYIVSFSKRKESAVALMAGKPDTFICHTLESDPQLFEALRMANPDCVFTVDNLASTSVEVLEDNPDLLYLDNTHHADYVAGELEKFGTKTLMYILVRGTGAFGEIAEGGGEGVFKPLRDFIKQNPEWYVYYHASHQYGLTILSRLPENRPATPIIPWPPAEGPGTELKLMLASLGITNTPACDCAAKAKQMDLWGVDGCIERKEQIVGWIKEGAPRWGWTSKLSAGWNAIFTGLAFQLDLANPYESLVTLAIERAAAKLPPKE